MACKIENLVLEKTASIDESASVYEATQRMAEHQLGSIIVTRNEKVAGLFTERDLINRIVSKDKDPKQEMVGNHATRELVRIQSHVSCQEAANKMRSNQCRRLLVYRGEIFLGMVLLQEVAHSLADQELGTGRLANYFAITIATLAALVIGFLIFQLPGIMRIAERIPGS